MDLLIRPEEPADRLDIHQVVAGAFEREDEAVLVDRLRSSSHFVPGLSLVALADSRLAGHILFTTLDVVGADGARRQSLALAPMAVRPEHQNRGIGSALVRYGLERAREQGFGSVIVHGHPEYYPRFGFVPASRWNIRSPFSPPDEVFLALELIPGNLAGVSGMVEYAPEFMEI